MEKERQKVFNYHRDNRYTDKEFIEQKNIINVQIRQGERILAENKVEEFNMEEALSHCFNFIRNTAKVWLGADYATRLRFQKQIFKGKNGAA